MASLLPPGGAVVLGALGLLSLARDLGWSQIKKLRSFTLLIIIITLILPMLSPLPVNMLGWQPAGLQQHSQYAAHGHLSSPSSSSSGP